MAAILITFGEHPTRANLTAVRQSERNIMLSRPSPYALESASYVTCCTFPLSAHNTSNVLLHICCTTAPTTR
jgi:hypothetical protein